MTEAVRILEAASYGEISKEDAEDKLIELGCDPADAHELVYLSTGGDDVVEARPE